MHQKIKLKYRRSLVAGLSMAEPAVKRWVVYLPESDSEFQEGRRQEARRVLGKKLSREFNYLVINKPGVTPHHMNARVFERSFRRERRVQDALITMKSLIPPDHEIFMLGYSEGAYLAPQVACEDARVIGVAMIGGGTRGWLKEELSNAGQLERSELLGQVRKILKSPRSLKKWNGFSYATWFSYREDLTLKALGRLRVPALAILGRRDRTIDFKSTLTDLRRLAMRKPVRVKVFESCGHSFVGHWADACVEVQRFLSRLPV
jgi:pimeloyl-ACP methyl ester carboxylesterase